jgi:hypothetical protein
VACKVAPSEAQILGTYQFIRPQRVGLILHRRNAGRLSSLPLCLRALRPDRKLLLSVTLELMAFTLMPLASSSALRFNASSILRLMSLAATRGLSMMSSVAPMTSRTARTAFSARSR